MGTHLSVKLRGESNEIVLSALVDTEGETSMMHSTIARNLGVWLTNVLTNVEDVDGEVKTLPIVVAYLNFPSLMDIGGEFAFAMREEGEGLIVGRDILELLGITVDDRTHQLSIKNETWEAFKTLADVGVLIYAGVKRLEVLSRQNVQKNSD
jgi:hypothetical protein